MTKPNDRETILYAYAVEPTHDRNTLERYLSRYPNLAEELIDLTSELRLGEALSPSPASEDTGLEAAWREFLACKPQEACAEKAVDPFERFRGKAFVQLAEALNVPRSFLTAFRDGLVAATSIPDRFIQRFARATSLPAEAVRIYFERPRAGLVARAFKSAEQPSHQGQSTFQELIQTTEMTDEQRQLLLEDCTADGLD